VTLELKLIIYLTTTISQGLLPTLMIAYVGLDLGVDTSVVTNSVAPKLYLRKRNMEAGAEPGQNTETIREVSVVLDIRLHDDEGKDA
jgi:hypothetical protein